MCSVTFNLYDCAQPGIIIELAPVGSPLSSNVSCIRNHTDAAAYTGGPISAIISRITTFTSAVPVSCSCGWLLAPMTSPPDQCDDLQMNGGLSLTIHALR